MGFVRRLIGYVLAFIVAGAVTYLLAAALYTQFVAKELAELGVVVPMETRLEWTMRDIQGLLNPTDGFFEDLTHMSYAAAIWIGLFIAFIVAVPVKAVLRPLRALAYPIAGAVAMWTVIYLADMIREDGMSVLAATRDWMGYGAQCLAGAIGGLVFAMLRPHQSVRSA